MARSVKLHKNLYGVGIYGDAYYGSTVDISIGDDWSYSNVINERSTFNCSVIDTPVTIEKGYAFDFYVDSTLEFAGIVTTVDREEISPGLLIYKLQISDWVHLLSKRRIGHVFVNQTAGYIINWIITNILYEDGVTAGTIQDGPTFDKVVFNYKTCEEAFNYLQDACVGYNWNINPLKQVDFISKVSSKCVTEINDTHWHDGLVHSDSLDEYRNIIYLEGGMKQTTEQEDYLPTPKPDGVSREFLVQFPIALEPTIEVNTGSGWVAQTVGINGLEENQQFYWTYGSEKITQDSSETVLADGHSIRVTYTGLVKVRMIIEDTEKVNERANIEGNSGKYEMTYVDDSISSNGAALQFGKGLINKYSDTSKLSLNIKKTLGDLAVNKLVKVTRTAYGIDNWYLIESINSSRLDSENSQYSLSLLSGESVGGWETYFKKLMPVTKEINAEDVFVQSKLLSENWSHQGEWNIRTASTLYISESTVVDDDLYLGIPVIDVTLYD